jgi:hypothetical protein
LEIISRTEKYESIRQATELRLNKTIRKKIIQIHKMDTENTPTVSMLIGGVHVAWMSLSMMILHDITPEGFVEKEKKK